MTALDIVYSLPFLLGALVGLVLDRIIKCAEAKWLDKHDPLPDGKAHKPAGYSRTYVAALLAAMTLGYVLLTMIRTENNYEGLAQELADCQAINAQNDRLSREQRDLFLDLNEAETSWLTRLVAPDSPEIAALDQNDPRREAWAIDVTIVYNERAGKLNEQIRAISDRQRALEAERAASPTCGEERERG